MNLELDYIDYPTGWAIQRAFTEGTSHHHKCSYHTGCFLCDCFALYFAWYCLKRNRTDLSIKFLDSGFAIIRENENQNNWTQFEANATNPSLEVMLAGLAPHATEEFKSTIEDICDLCRCPKSVDEEER
jgi:hypothetical protein